MIPPAIIFVNNDLVDQVKSFLMNQLFISEAIDGYTFDQRIAADSGYADAVKSANQRLLVIRPMSELDNRSYADIVIFIKEGLASVLKNKFGPPGATFPVIRIYWGELGVFYH